MNIINRHDRNNRSANKTSYTVIPWPRTRGGPHVMLHRFVQAARQQGYHGWPSLLTFNRNQPCLFMGHAGQDKLLNSSRHSVYRVAGMFIEEHFRRIGAAFADREFRPEYRAANQQIRAALIQADFVIYQSAWSKSHLDTLHQRADNTWDIIPNAVSLQKFTPAQDKIKRQDERPLLGTVGFLRSRPRLEVFFDVARRLPIRPRLLLIGAMDGYCQKTLEQAQADPYWRDSIRYIPSISPKKLARYYQEMDCLVHAVVGDSCPNVVVEALACGVPVVCPLEGGTVELVGPAGVAVDDPEMIYGETLRAGMAEGVQTVLANLPHYRHMARQQAEKNNGVDRLTRRYLQALGFSPSE